MRGTGEYLSQDVAHSAPVEFLIRISEVAGPPFVIILMFPLLVAGFVILALMWTQRRFDLTSEWISAHQARRHHLQAQRMAAHPGDAIPVEEEQRLAL